MRRVLDQMLTKYLKAGWTDGLVVKSTARTALPGDPASIPSTNMAVHNCL